MRRPALHPRCRRDSSELPLMLGAAAPTRQMRSTGRNDSLKVTQLGNDGTRMERRVHEARAIPWRSPRKSHQGFQNLPTLQRSVRTDCGTGQPPRARELSRGRDRSCRSGTQPERQSQDISPLMTSNISSVIREHSWY